MGPLYFVDGLSTLELMTRFSIQMVIFLGELLKAGTHPFCNHPSKNVRGNEWAGDKTHVQEWIVLQFSRQCERDGVGTPGTGMPT